MDNTAIIRRINVLLAEKGISKSQFYSDCGVTSGNYSVWNTGKAAPSRRSIERIANYLNTTPEYLLTGEGQKEKPAPIKEDGLSEEQIKVLRLFDSLTPQEQRALLATARGLIASRQDPDSL
jgi:transcriptional regulator with XRE-family HTH domain